MMEMGLILLLLVGMMCLCGGAPINMLANNRGRGVNVAAAAAAAAGPIGIFVQTIREAKRHLIAAAVARSVSIFGMYPVDTIKTRMQMEQANPLRLNGLYSGVGGSLLGQVPYG
jgi:hypothetical protein